MRTPVAGRARRHETSAAAGRSSRPVCEKRFGSPAYARWCASRFMSAPAGADADTAGRLAAACLPTPEILLGEPSSNCSAIP